MHSAGRGEREIRTESINVQVITMNPRGSTLLVPSREMGRLSISLLLSFFHCLSVAGRGVTLPALPGCPSEVLERIRKQGDREAERTGPYS